MASHSTPSDSTPAAPTSEETPPGSPPSTPGSPQAAESPFAEIDAEDDTPEEVYDEIMRSFEAKDVATASRLRANGWIPPGGFGDADFTPRILPLDESEADPAGRACSKASSPPTAGPPT